jgi:hypothetical protein
VNAGGRRREEGERKIERAKNYTSKISKPKISRIPIICFEDLAGGVMLVLMRFTSQSKRAP